MAKVFNGGEFLNQKAIKIVLSNGVTAEIKELSDEAIMAIEAMGKSESSGIDSARQTLAVILGKNVEELKSIGIVELRGAIDFLSSSLFE